MTNSFMFRMNWYFRNCKASFKIFQKRCLWSYSLNQLTRNSMIQHFKSSAKNLESSLKWWMTKIKQRLSELRLKCNQEELYELLRNMHVATI